VEMEILGHSQFAVTLNTYTHVVSAMQDEAMAKMNEVLGPAGVDGGVVEPDEARVGEE
jgi:hypothetical protein